MPSKKMLILSQSFKKNYIGLVFILLTNTSFVYGSFEDISGDVFGEAREGIIASFGDFDSNKLTDIFVINTTTVFQKVVVYSAQPDNVHLKPDLSLGDDRLFKQIQGVITSDFDGDSCLDVAIVSKGDSVGVTCYFGNYDSISASLNVSLRFTTPPQLVDWNGTMIPNLFGVSHDNNLLYWAEMNAQRNDTTRNRVLSETKIDGKSPLWSVSTLVNDDLAADFVSAFGSHGYEVYVRKYDSTSGSSVLATQENLTFYLSDKVKQRGNVAALDVDGDGTIEVLVGVCYDDECTDSAIMAYSFQSQTWVRLASKDTFKDGSSAQWGFVTPDGEDAVSESSMTLHAGDYNQDNYPDVLCLLQSGGKRRAVLLKNTPCSGGDTCNGTRTFSPAWDELKTVKGAVNAAFFDILEDGILDVVMTAKDEDKYKMFAFRNKQTEDAAFLKVLVLSGRPCASGWCEDRVTPYGLNIPGPSVQYDTTDYGDAAQRSAAVQLSQSSYFALQLPYSVFGLGRTSNFIEKLRVGIQRLDKRNNGVERTWQQIIPNAQLVVVPHGDPSTWVSKLFVTPSKLIWDTAFVLLAILAALAVVFCVLHVLEKRADRREKLEQAQMFHFDAM